MRPYVGSSLALLGLVAACGHADDAQAPREFRAVDPVCTEEAPDDDAWICDQTRTVSCAEADAQDIPLHVELAPGACDDAQLQPVQGPFGPGQHTVQIEDDQTNAVVCTATLEVTDDDAPEVATHDTTLWPPNHKLHEISLHDCIDTVDDCDDDWTAHIVAVSSDEPANDQGDGNTDADIVVIDAQTVSVRAERQGGSNGRVYTIDFEVTDNSGNATEATCIVAVVHDQSGDAAIDDGAAYTVQWPQD